MRVLIFLILILVAGYSILDLMGILTKERDLNPLLQKQGIQKVKVPKELKDKYIEIAKNEKKIFYKTKRMENLEVISPEKINPVLSQNKLFPLKIKEQRVYKDNLYIDVYVKNKTDKDYEGKVKILCKTYNDSGLEQDIFTWSKRIKLKANKVTLIKGIKLGYINLENSRYLRCKVEKAKRY